MYLPRLLSCLSSATTAPVEPVTVDLALHMRSDQSDGWCMMTRSMTRSIFEKMPNTHASQPSRARLTTPYLMCVGRLENMGTGMYHTRVFFLSFFLI
ncbi:hypothetical protein F4808DRAFT_134633 [Astrocystis sublimbata]|nr:hypothetical protein F4808DRAFT_134633 [Astrocystis sublimbata]